MSAELRFVILEHNHPFLHWDLMLETGNLLQTWRLLNLPETNVWVPAEPLNDHRLAYLTYEGPVSNNRGHVSRVTSGTYRNALDPGVASQLSRVLELRDCNAWSVAEQRMSSDVQCEWRFR